MTYLCICRSRELIQRALMDNDFMKHLEHGQVRNWDQHPSHVIDFKHQLIGWFMCADPHHHGLYVSHQPRKRLLCHPGRR